MPYSRLFSSSSPSAPISRAKGRRNSMPHGGQHQTAENGGEDGHGKKLVRFFRLALAHGFGDQRAAARAEHETHAAQNHQKGHY